MVTTARGVVVTRRAFLATATAAVSAGALATAHAWAQAPPQASGWALADQILAAIAPPVFPDRSFPITDFGAVPGAVTDATEAIRRAIAACVRAGGGRVVVPAGRFLTGAIRLQSGVNLHLDADATLLFERDPRAYLPVVFTRFEGTEVMNYSPFIYAFEAQNIAITGAGTLDGQADDDTWWPWARGPATPARAKLVQLADRGAPVAERVFGDGGFLRPNFVQPYRCQNVLIDGITIVRSPMWEIHPVLSTNVTVRNVTIHSHGPNNDGCDPESCRDVHIDGCTFDTGDDCIALKSGKNDDGRRVHVPIERVVIENCTMLDGHGGVTIGSEISGGARQIFARRCRMNSAHLDRVLRFKNNSVRGGTIEQIYMRDITVGEVAGAIVDADFYYDEGDTGRYTPILRDVDVRNVTSQKSQSVLRLRGYARAPIANIRLTDCRFDGVTGDDVVEGARDVVFSNVTVNGTRREGP